MTNTTDSGSLFIEFDEGAARWGNATDAQIDAILAFAVSVLGDPDTTV